jgi:hypothetical protein
MIGIPLDFWFMTGVIRENWKKSTVLQLPYGHCNVGNLTLTGEKIIILWLSVFQEAVYPFWHIHFKTGTMLEFSRFFYGNIRN